MRWWNVFVSSGFHRPLSRPITRSSEQPLSVAGLGLIRPLTLMHLLIASDYGNPVTYLLGLPLLLLSLVVGWIGLHNRWRPLLISCGVVCMLGAGLLYLTLGESDKDRTLTAVVAGLLFVMGIVFFTAKRPDGHDDDATR